MYKSTNPTLKNMSHYCSGEELVGAGEKKTASYLGVSLKALFYIALTIISAAVSAAVLFSLPSFVMVALIAAPVLALVCSLVCSFKPAACPIAGSLYAVFEGIAVGALSAIVDAAFGGVVLTAFLATFITFAVMVVLYATGIIRVGSRFRNFMISALLALIVAQLLFFVVSLFSPAAYALFYGNGFLAMLISAVMVLFAAFFILVDLSDITMLVEGRMEKQLEWRAAFGLSVTLIWLYIEFLRLAMIIFSRRK